MNTVRRAARAGRNLLIALLVGAVIIVAIVVAYVVGRSSGTTTAAPPTSPASAAPSRSSAATEDSAPTGCLGGEARTNEMLLTAQKTAQHSTYGAVEVATAFYRWSYRFPVPSAPDVKAIGAVFVPGQSAKSEASLLDGYAENPNPAAGTVEKGKPFYITTVGARWIAQAGGSADSTQVSLQAPYVIDGVVSSTKTATAAFDVRWVDGAWRVAGLAKGDPARVTAGGTMFTAGC